MSGIFSGSCSCDDLRPEGVYYATTNLYVVCLLLLSTLSLVVDDVEDV